MQRHQIPRACNKTVRANPFQKICRFKKGYKHAATLGILSRTDYNYRWNRATQPKTKKSCQKKDTHYSGKKKKYTVQNQITTNLNGEIIHKSPHAPGSHHDYRIYKSKHPTLSKVVFQFFDLGYVGVEKDFKNQISVLPYKKKKGKKLTAQQKAYNKTQSKIRIKVEHAIAQIKKFRISSEVFRNKLSRHDTISEIVCGIVNYKIKWKKEFIVIP